MILKLEKLFQTLAMTDGQISTAVSQFTGQHITSDLIAQAANRLPITAIHADLICRWLSQQYGKEIKPEDTDIKVHAASALPDSAVTEEKIRGFIAGWQLAYEARSKNRALSNQEIREQATSKRLTVFSESAGNVAPLRNAAYENSFVFAANSLEAIFSQPGGDKKYAEWRSWLPTQRDQYARSMAEDLIKYL